MIPGSETQDGVPSVQLNTDFHDPDDNYQRSQYFSFPHKATYQRTDDLTELPVMSGWILRMRLFCRPRMGTYEPGFGTGSIDTKQI